MTFLGVLNKVSVVMGLVLSCLLACASSPTLQTASNSTSPPPSADQVPALSKIAMSLRHVVQRLQAEGHTAVNVESYSTPLVRVDPSGRVQTVILVTSVDDDIQLLLQQKQVKIEFIDSKQHVIQGWIPFQQVESVAALSVVRYMRPPSYAVNR